MNAVLLKKRFFELLPPPLPSDWEAEENIANLVTLSEEKQDLILGQVQAIWPVSNSLCYSYLSCADKALACLDDEQVGDWVSSVLDIYEKMGLKEAQNFMADVEGQFLCRLRGETGVEFSEIVSRLQPYAQGIARQPVNLTEGVALYTDTSRIFLPGKLTLFRSEAENFLLYKLMITAQLQLLQDKTLDFTMRGTSGLAVKIRDEFPSLPHDNYNLEEFWNMFPDPRLAEDIFTTVEGVRISGQLQLNFPGLWNDTHLLREKLAEKRACPPGGSARTRLMEELAAFSLTGRFGEKREGIDSRLNSLLKLVAGADLSDWDSAEKTVSIYSVFHDIKGEYEPASALPYIGRFRLAEARRVKLQKREESRQKFIDALSRILPDTSHPKPEAHDEGIEAGNSASRLTSDQVTALILAPGQERESPETLQSPEVAGEHQSLVTMDGPDIEIPEHLKSLGAEIIDDLGHIPDEYISTANGFAGKGPPPQINCEPAEGQSLHAAITYDEWDYRRAGYRKDWCILHEKPVLPVKGSFVPNTLEKHKGLLKKLKKQFEMLRSSERFMKRQRDGDDIDLDAAIDALSDLKAGRPESEKLFIKLKHVGRDIGVMFLIDMSSSTEGWVGEALKESLILMSESLEVLGDRYAIAGFSGMRRTRSEFFHIKDFTEKYSDEIKGRIAAISPQEYTRMGPPVRHATKMLQKVDAKVRLLIILSDGKPEDYDDYKGEYAIEDTRHALIEAKAAGIHPFCITIDQQAHDYNAHMYGEVNYIFLDNVSNLPLRIPTIYRNLTT